MMMKRKAALASIVALLSLTGAAVAPPDSPVGSCTVERDGVDNIVQWRDDGGRHVLRRNGSWLVTLGTNASSFRDIEAPDGASYELRTRRSGTLVDQDCLAREPVALKRVVLISVDGLRSDHVTVELMPALSELRSRGASTLNARTDPALTKTLPNHTSQLTGRFVWGAGGHRITFNEDRGTTVHDEALGYVPSVFDVVHDHGGRTVMYVGKEKFEVLDRSWDATNGAPDSVGEDDGADKIDVYVKEDPNVAVAPFAADMAPGEGLQFGFFHIRLPDSAGHEFGWGSEEYRAAVSNADQVIDDVVRSFEGDGAATTFVITSDHGGPLGDDAHSTQWNAENYTIPFVVVGAQVDAGDLYEFNPLTRADPGEGRPNRSGPQPVRGHDAANLVLELLELPALASPAVNADHDLVVSTPVE